MTVRQDPALLQSVETGHYATSVGEGKWVVTWIPGRQFDCDTAASAVLVAATVDSALADIAVWASDLGLTAKEAMGLVVSTPYPEPPLSSQASPSTGGGR